MKVSKLAVAAGITTAGAILLLGHMLQRAAFPDGSAPYPMWYAVLEPILGPLDGVVPGVVAGWLARDRPLLHGVLVAAGGALVALAFAFWSFGSIPVGVVAIALTFGFLTSTITQCIGALAGVALRTERAGI